MKTAKAVALVPAWKSAAFIELTLEALAAQTYPDLRVLISDDASPDATCEICERFAAGDARFTVLRQTRNLGWVGNVNALLEATAAEASYLLFAFQDDLLEPEYVERCVAALEANPGAVMAFTDIELIQQDGSKTSESYHLLDGVTDRLERARLVAKLAGAWWIPNRGVFRAGAAESIGGLRHHRAGEFSADWPWLLHMSLLGEFVRVPGRLCTKIYQSESLSRSWRFGPLDWIAVSLSALRTVWRAGIPQRERLVLSDVLLRFIGDHLRRGLRLKVERELRRSILVRRRSG